MDLETLNVQCNQSPSESRPGQARSCAHHGAQLRGADVGVRGELQDRGALGMRVREIAHAPPILDAKHTHTHTERERERERISQTNTWWTSHTFAQAQTFAFRCAFAPSASSMRTTSSWPRLAAVMRGLTPCCSEGIGASGDTEACLFTQLQYPNEYPVL